jgi:hypothetical protein
LIEIRIERHNFVRSGRLIARSKKLRGRNLVQGCKLLLDRRADGTIALLDQIEEHVIGMLGDVSGQRFFVERRDIMPGEIGQETIERPVLGVSRAQLQGFISKGFVGSKAGMLAIQPVTKFGQDGSSFSEREEATAYSVKPSILQGFLD